jgi:hypothetical protein
LGKNAKIWATFIYALKQSMPSPVFTRLLFSTTFYKELLYYIALKYAELIIDNVMSGCVWSPHKTLWYFYFVRNA